MSPTIAEIRDGMAEAILTGTNLRCHAYLSTTLSHPCAYIQPGSYDPRQVLGKSKVQYPFKVYVFVGSIAEASAQRRCDVLREPDGTGSIVAAIEDGTLWPVTVDYASVTLVSEVTESSLGEEILLTFELDVEVQI